MKVLAFVGLIVVLLAVTFQGVEAGGYGKHKKKKIPVDINTVPELFPDRYPGLKAQPVPAQPLEELPRAFSWCAHPDGQNYCGASWNQHLNVYCGACWVHSTLSMVADRLKYELRSRIGTPADVMLARQDVLDCSRKFGWGDGCNGGESVDVLEYMRQYGVPDETCKVYRADSNGVCDMNARCGNCMMLQNDTLSQCWNVPNYIKYKVKEYGFVRGEQAMMSEIAKRGPIACGIAVDDDFCFNYKGGVWEDKNNSTDVDHDVEVVGWGEDDGGKFWIIRNSWGSYWGENGFFRIRRGVNMMHLEEKCSFAVVDVSELDDHLAGNTRGTMFGLIKPEETPKLIPDDWNKRPHKYAPSEEVAEELRKMQEGQKWIDKHVPLPPLQLTGTQPPSRALPSALPAGTVYPPPTPYPNTYVSKQQQQKQHATPLPIPPATSAVATTTPTPPPTTTTTPPPPPPPSTPVLIAIEKRSSTARSTDSLTSTASPPPSPSSSLSSSSSSSSDALPWVIGFTAFVIGLVVSYFFFGRSRHEYDPLPMKNRS